MPEMSAQDAQLQFVIEEYEETQRSLTLKVARLRISHQIEVNELKAEIDRLQAHINELQQPPERADDHGVEMPD